MSSNIIIAKKPTLKIQINDKFLMELMKGVEIIDLTSLVFLYKEVFTNNKDILIEKSFHYKNTEISYLYANKTLFLKDIKQYQKNDDNDLIIKCSEYFVAKLIRERSSINSILPTYFYSLRYKLMNNQSELLKKELTIGNETIVFSIINDNTLLLITGWIGNRNKINLNNK